MLNVNFVSDYRVMQDTWTLTPGKAQTMAVFSGRRRIARMVPRLTAGDRGECSHIKGMGSRKDSGKSPTIHDSCIDSILRTDVRMDIVTCSHQSRRLSATWWRLWYGSF